MFCSRDMNRRINYVHERTLRLVYQDYSSTFDQLLGEDGSVSFHHRNIRTLATEMFKVRGGLAPSIFSDLFTYLVRGDKFIIPGVKSVKKGKYSVRYFGPVVWNTMVPSNIKSNTILEEFKTAIGKWVPKCKCDLCVTVVQGVGVVNVVNG